MNTKIPYDENQAFVGLELVVDARKKGIWLALLED